MVDSKPSASRRVFPVLAVALVVLAIAAVTAWWTGGGLLGTPSHGLRASDPLPAAGKLDTRPPILLVTLDTQRFDHLGTYGYFRDTSPVLDQLASQGIVFEGAMSTAGLTFPSHLSMFTGLYPHQHGMLGNVQAANQPFVPGPGRKTVAELLAADGYQTAAFVSAAPVKSRTGLTHGFQTYDEPDGGARNCDQTVARATRWIRSQANLPEPTFFVWVHIWEPHPPYRLEEQWEGSFEADEQVYALLEERRVDPEKLLVTERKASLRRFFGDRKSKAKAKGRRRPGPLVVDMESMADLVDRYDAEILHADACLGRLIDELEETDQYDRSIIAVVGDHGQGLGQHGRLGHGKTTLDNLRVPMVVRFPPGVVEQPARIDGVVSTVDLVPTLLARFDSEATRVMLEQAAGEDLLSGSYERLDAFAIDAVTGHDIDPEGTYSWVGERWKLVYRPGNDPALYDLSVDINELEDVADRHPEVVEQATSRTLQILGDRPAAILGQEAPLEDTPLADELRALGYVQ